MKCQDHKRGVIGRLCVAAICVAVSMAAAGQTVRDAVETLRADLKADRKTAIAAEMNMDEQESAAFWPLYDSYRAEVDKVIDRFVLVLLEYGDLYPNVPEEKARALLQQYTEVEADLLDAKRKYLKKIGKVLPPSKVLRFAQLDNRFDLGVRIGLASRIPVIGSGPPAKPN